jgi:hypothetical protein
MAEMTEEAAEYDAGFPIGKAYVDVSPRVSGLARVARIIEKHMGALAAELEEHDAKPEAPEAPEVAG